MKHVFVEFSCLFFDLMDVGNLIPASSAFSKYNLYSLKFSGHILLKPNWKDFEHYLASMWNEHNCVVIWTLFDSALLGIGMKTDFSSPVATVEFSKFAGILNAAL